MSHRPLHAIAAEIRKDWGSKINYAARPYLDAMCSMDSVTDMYFQDTGKYVVTYFLGNAGTWRGEVAKRVKAELKGMCK